jgi:hypothetical protein
MGTTQIYARGREENVCGEEAKDCKLRGLGRLCLRSEDAFVITCVANLMEVKVLYVQHDLRYEISSYWHFSV